MNKDIHISVVSHGQSDLVMELFHDLALLPVHSMFQITLIINIRDSLHIECSQFPFPILVIKNESPKGFGDNHNQAFKNAPMLEQRKFFFVVNPDVRINEDAFSILASVLSSNRCNGVVAPLVVNSEGSVEDSSRKIPTPLRIIKKAFGIRDHCISHCQGHSNPDWVAGMFMGFRSEVFEKIGGFDHRYFLYYEDVDICSRLWLDGYRVVLDPSAVIIHNAQRSSHKSLKYMRWHLSSMMRFFLSTVYLRVKKLHENRALPGCHKLGN